MFPTPIDSFTLFGHRFEVFGLFVALAIALGAIMMDREMERLRFSKKESARIFWWILVFGLYTSHYVEIFFYHPYRLENPKWSLFLNPLNGMSSTGGFLGAAASFLFMKRWLKGRWLEVADAAVVSLLAGWAIARLGCTFAFDHPGRLSNFFLAFEHPEGGSRHNMGFYEALYTLLVLIPAAWILHRRKSPPGSQLAMACILYAPVRFGMDFLRATDLRHSDLRYLGLTFAQYATISFLLSGLWLLRQIGTKNKKIGYT